MAKSNKTNHYLFGIAKVAVLSISAVYIFYRLKDIDFSQIQNLMTIQNTDFSFIVAALLFFLSLSIFNWALESLKWKYLVSTIKPIDFPTAFKQTLTAFSASVATPIKAGDYGAKVLFFPTAERKKIFGLNLISNLIQMAVTTFFGIFGLVFFLSRFVNVQLTERIILFFSGIIFLLILFFFLRKKNLLWSGVSIQKTIGFFSNLNTKIKVQILMLSVGRYIVFSLMFYFLLLFFGIDLSFSIVMMLIFTMYFLVSIVPTFFIFDIIIRGSVSVWLFSFYDISESIVFSAVGLMWVFNFVLPAVVGSYFVVRFKPAFK